MTRYLRARPARLWGQLLFWGAYALLMGLSWRMAGKESVAPSTTWAIALGVSGTLLLCSEALRALALRQRWLERPLLGMVWRVGLAVPLVATLGQLFIRLGITAGLHLGLLHMPEPMQSMARSTMVIYVLNSCLMLWMWMALWFGVQALKRWRQEEVAHWRTEAQQQQLELKLLQAQLNPHFLFNAINNVRSLILEDPARAREMLGSLSNTLQHSLRRQHEVLVPLQEELQLVRDYLALQQLHHEQRLQVQWALQSGCEAALVPPLALQLLVENAIKHGIARVQGGGTLRIALWRASQGELVLEVENPGALTPAAPHAAAQGEGGVGLSNLRHRLSRLPVPGQLTLQPSALGVLARLTLPAQA
ncbi:sensor histidine kinase [Roseateles sp. BYS180W]|uniref:Sensor histidine kinase n=1 Tax=Roseateles rivi TaxID=3299028 RepID=A0ABW7FYX6_9BURK